MTVVKAAWRELQRATALLTAPVSPDVDASIANALRESAVARGIDGFVRGTARAWQASNTQRLWNRWSARAHAVGSTGVRDWSATIAVACIVHLLVLSLIATTRGPLQWVLPALVLVGSGLAWLMASRSASAVAPEPRDRVEF